MFSFTRRFYYWLARRIQFLPEASEDRSPFAINYLAKYKSEHTQTYQSLMDCIDEYEAKVATMLTKLNGHTMTLCKIKPWDFKTRAMLAHAMVRNHFPWYRVSSIDVRITNCYGGYDSYKYRNDHSTLDILFNGKPCGRNENRILGLLSIASNDNRGFACYYGRDGSLRESFLHNIEDMYITPDTIVFLTWILGLIPSIHNRLKEMADDIDRRTDQIRANREMPMKLVDSFRDYVAGIRDETKAG